jgi:diguanylate cyclase
MLEVKTIGGLRGRAMNSQPRYRVLIVDDNEAIHKDIYKILSLGHNAAQDDLDQMAAELFGGELNAGASDLGFSLESAFQGVDALEMVKTALGSNNPYALAIVDVRMPPGWDGIETVEHLWEVDPRLQIVICTAYSDQSWGEIVCRVGHRDSLLILRKPFDRVEMLQATTALTRKWTLYQGLHKKLTDLDTLVQHRTQELRSANDQLKEEIKERCRVEHNFRHLATHDALTDLPNRVLLHDRLEQTLSRARRFKHSVGVLLLDLDHFKEINDTLGHKTGDLLLQQVSLRLSESIRECDTAARMGGDEFVIVVDDLARPENASIVADRLVRSFGAAFQLDAHTVKVTCSIGVAVFPKDGDSVENLMKSADIAMYQAKHTGRNTYRIYSGSEKEAPVERGELLSDLKVAVEKEQLMLWYQPLFGLDGTTPTGMEALLRWQHPVHGLITPLSFIPLAEQSDLMLTLGYWVLRTACLQNARWQREGYCRIPVAVNLTARQFQDEALIPTIARILEEVDLAPGFLELEITESTAMRDIERCRTIIQGLRSLGTRIVIDDFGSGYSSLNRLRKLPIDALKIDRFFLQNIVEDERDATIVMAVIALANSLGIQVIAEGVETAAQLAFLRSLKWDVGSDLHCDRVQGFLFSKPVPPEQATTLLTRPAERDA